MTIELIVGLGNPGAAYEKTRHNAGVWFIDALSEKSALNFKAEKKFLAQLANYNNTRLLIPNQYMNQSGQSVRLAAKFYKLEPEQILIVHDELDLEPGTIKLKQGGGHGGHNGLRDIINQLGSKQFHRLRIGIGHPGHKDDVHDYVLGKPANSDKKSIHCAIDRGVNILPTLLQSGMQQAMLLLHS